jgi:hypothetical protein
MPVVIKVKQAVINWIFPTKVVLINPFNFAEGLLVNGC